MTDPTKLEWGVRNDPPRDLTRQANEQEPRPRRLTEDERLKLALLRALKVEGGK